MKVLLIIQARMGSTRLPGKVLKDLNGKPLLSRVVERLSKAEVDEICIATTLNPEDEAIESFGKKHDIKVYRGSDWDVLDRFYQCAKTFQLAADDLVVRICADNPLHHWEVVNFCIHKAREGKYQYFSNSNREPDILEDGFDVEVFRYALLEQAWNEAELLSEREHVCPYMKQAEKFKCGWEKYRKDYMLKLSVDTLEDFKVAENIFQHFGDIDFSMDDVVDYLNNNPQILDYNKHSTINSGYHKSLREDKKVK
ncbi:MAG: cytidylyltransferase domain-containing protein [Luteibaculum sp.]